MSRGLWFVAGAGAGVYAMVRGRRAAEALTADGLRDRWNGLAHGARVLRDEVAQGRADAEADLRERLGLRPDATRELSAAPPDQHAGLQQDDRHHQHPDQLEQHPTRDEEGTT